MANCKDKDCKLPHYTIGKYKYHAKASVVSNPKQKPIKPISDKQKVRLIAYNKLRLEYMNNNPLCEVMFDCCTKYATEIHHKSSRIGDNLFKHFVATCRSCHRHLHDFISLEEGIELGLLLRKT